MRQIGHFYERFPRRGAAARVFEPLKWVVEIHVRRSGARAVGLGVGGEGFGVGGLVGGGVGVREGVQFEGDVVD